MSLAAVPPVPSHFQTFLAFDFGLKRTGVAVGNRMLRTATAQPTRPKAPEIKMTKPSTAAAAASAGRRRASESESSGKSVATSMKG